MFQCILPQIVLAMIGPAASIAPPSPRAAGAMAFEPVTREERLGACVAATKIAPATLAASWPSLIGQRVIVDGVAVERAIDFTEVVAVAGGVRFAVLLSPGQQWAGRLRRTFTIVGSVRVPLRGRVVLPELLLEPEGVCGT